MSSQRIRRRETARRHRPAITTRTLMRPIPPRRAPTPAARPTTQAPTAAGPRAMPPRAEHRAITPLPGAWAHKTPRAAKAKPMARAAHRTIRTILPRNQQPQRKRRGAEQLKISCSALFYSASMRMLNRIAMPQVDKKRKPLTCGFNGRKPLST